MIKWRFKKPNGVYKCWGRAPKLTKAWYKDCTDKRCQKASYEFDLVTDVSTYKREGKEYQELLKMIESDREVKLMYEGDV